MFERRPWAAAGVASASLLLVAYVVGITLAAPGSAFEGFLTSWVYQVLIAASVVITAARVILFPSERLAWSVIALALASTCFAEVYYLAVAPEEYPSLADAAWLAFYPLLYVGLVLLVRKRLVSVVRTLWLDGLTASFAAAAVGAAVLVEVVLRTTEESFSTAATNVAYPIGDLLLLSALFGIFSLTGWRMERRWVVLGLGVLATAVADGFYLFQVDTYQAGTVLDVLWPVSSLLIAAASWVAARDEHGLEVAGRPLLAVPTIGALIGTGILVLDHFERMNLLAVVLSAATLLLILVRLAVTFRENARLFALTRQESITDALTGLGNRRKLIADLQAALSHAQPVPTLLMIFDLDGFKGYNDGFGHPAGDALLARLGAKLALVPGDRGAAYRLGGDEFCLIARVVPEETEAIIDRASKALCERGEGFDVSTSFGAVLLPDEATEASQALGLADERLYAQKHSRREDTDRTMHVLLGALTTREPELRAHVEGVAELALEVGKRLGLQNGELDELFRAAQLHDLGKLAVPDEILRKRGPLDEREWEFIRQHTVVGERILRASIPFKSTAGIVRFSHENWDGTGYPDGLAADEIPFASRIIRVCDAYSAMTETRPYRPALTGAAALAELGRGSGVAFDPTVVRAVLATVREQLEAERAA